jgi:alpha-aminoadipic semialdehyde synthase
LIADLGIRREDKNRWERRAPLTPWHVEELVGEQGRRVIVQPSALRVYPDDDYRAAGAEVAEDLAPCRVILGIKEVPPHLLLPGKPYLAFFHVIKGQPHNMPLLRRALDLRCTLMDYEPVVDPSGQRLIFFGRYAGHAGMIDALWALGRRLAAEGVASPFEDVRPAHAYGSLAEATAFLDTVVGRRIREQGIGPELHPLVVGFTGGGNVSQGAQEVLDHLPVVSVHPDELADLAADPGRSHRAVYKVVFRRDQRADFARRLPHLTVLVNGIYWAPGHPRLVTRADAARLWGGGAAPKLRVIADLSCDVGGGIEINVQTTDSGDPVYVFEPATGAARMGVEGRGPVILAVDNLPCELPRDASEHFGDALFPFLAPLAAADYQAPYERLGLPPELLRAVVAHAGELTPPYRHLEAALAEHAPLAAAAVG